MLGLLRGLSSFIILFIRPYSCCLCRICWVKADWGLVVSNVSDVFLEEYFQIVASLAYIQ
jgi:hypothetical protein